MSFFPKRESGKKQKKPSRVLDGFLLLCYNNKHNSGNMPFFCEEKKYEFFRFVMAESSFH